MRRIFVLVPFLGLLAACRTDPYDTPGTWQVKNVNDANLREMVANPNDLVAGQSASGSWGHEAASAVQRLIDDKPRALISTTSTTAVTPSAGGGAGP